MAPIWNTMVLCIHGRFGPRPSYWKEIRISVGVTAFASYQLSPLARSAGAWGLSLLLVLRLTTRIIRFTSFLKNQHFRNSLFEQDRGPAGMLECWRGSYCLLFGMMLCHANLSHWLDIIGLKSMQVSLKRVAKFSPGQLCVLHLCNSVDWPCPLQFCPPFAGKGLVQERERRWVPDPHELVHWDQ